MPRYIVTSTPGATPITIDVTGSFEVFANYVFWNEGAHQPTASVFVGPGGSVIEEQSQTKAQTKKLKKKDGKKK